MGRLWKQTEERVCGAGAVESSREQQRGEEREEERKREEIGGERRGSDSTYVCDLGYLLLRTTKCCSCASCPTHPKTSRSILSTLTTTSLQFTKSPTRNATPSTCSSRFCHQQLLLRLQQQRQHPHLLLKSQTLYMKNIW